MSYSPLLDGEHAPHELTDDDFEASIGQSGVWKTLWNLQLAWTLERERLLEEIDRLQNLNAHLNKRTAELGEEVGRYKHPMPAWMKRG